MSLRDVEHRSIENFIRAAAQDGLIRGEVLDLGCGRQPYRRIIEAYGKDVTLTYHGFDRPTFGGTLGITEGADALLDRGWDTVLSTQVIQYVDDPREWLDTVRHMLRAGGHLVITGPTNWPIVESADRWRFTPSGIGVLLEEVGFRKVTIAERACWEDGGEKWLLGWGAIARS